MNIFLWALFGVATAVIIYTFENKASRQRFVSVLILGIIGAIAGGLFANLVLGIGTRGFTFSSLMAASAGALIFWMARRALKKI